jgi:5-hydroxyisourate hydrolase
MSPITTHVLDTAPGRPAEGVAVVLEQRREDGSWHELGRGTTNADGRVTDLLPEQHVLEGGVYRLRFGSGDYFYSLGLRCFYPEVRVLVQIDAGGHYHLPLLLSPFGYSTYRGS